VNSIGSSAYAPHKNARSASAFYTFTVRQEGVYTIRLVTVGASDARRAKLRLLLCQKNLSVIEEARSGAGVGTTQEIRERLAAGPYVVEVRSWDPRCSPTDLSGCNSADFEISQRRQSGR
jgi:hypothetical protein